MKRKSKYDPLFDKLKSKLPQAFKRTTLNQAVIDVLLEKTKVEIEKKGLDYNSLDEFSQVMSVDEFDNNNQRQGLYRLINKHIFEIKYKVHGRFSPADVFSFRETVDGLELASAFTTNNMYFSNLSAMYILGLIDQRPLSHYISKETHMGSSGKFEYDEDLAKMTFRKKPRTSTRYILYKNMRIYFLEKQHSNNIGVENISIKKKGHNEYSFRCTNIERTFIDSIMAPHYSGGTEVVLDVFRKCKLNISKLLSIYKEINPVYPYWQKIGFFLDLMGKIDDANLWRDFFHDVPMKKFFADREYRSEWSLNNKWEIYYPDKVDAIVNER